VQLALSASKKYISLTKIIQKVFSEGINEKDSISTMALLRPSESNNLGNVILAT
jgi:hypothetical protein